MNWERRSHDQKAKASSTLHPTPDSLFIPLLSRISLNLFLQPNSSALSPNPPHALSLLTAVRSLLCQPLRQRCLVSSLRLVITATASSGFCVTTPLCCSSGCAVFSSHNWHPEILASIHRDSIACLQGSALEQSGREWD